MPNEQYKYTRDSFLQSVRNKYPVYNKWEDEILFDALLKKYPIYKNQIEPKLEEKLDVFSKREEIFQRRKALIRKGRFEEREDDWEPPKQLQDRAKIIQIPEGEIEPKYYSNTAQLLYTPARLYSLIERPAFAAAELTARGLRIPVKLFGKKTKLANALDYAVEYYGQPEKHGLVTPFAAGAQQAYRASNYQKSFALGIMGDIAETGTDIASYIAQIQLLGKISPSAPLSKVPLKELGKRIKRIGLHGALTTKGDVSDRIQSTITRIGYNVTPFIANATGATGLGAVTVDIMLNTFLTSPTYLQAYKEAGGINKEFISMAIPQFIMDVAMAWNTRGLPENILNKKLELYLKDRPEGMKLPVKEGTKLIKSLQGELFELPKDVRPAEKVTLPEPEVTAKPSEKPTAKVSPEIKGKIPVKKIKPIETPEFLPTEIPKTIAETKKFTRAIKFYEKKYKNERDAFFAGEKVGRIETRKKMYQKLKDSKIKADEVRKSILQYANENLTKKDRSKIGLLASRTKTKRGLARVFQIIDGIEERYQRHFAISELKSTVKKLDIKRLRPEYKKTIEEIVDSIDLVNRRDKTINRLNKMLTYIERNPENNIPSEKLIRLTILSKMPIKNITTEDINLIKDSIGHYVHLNNLKNKIIVGKKIRDFKEVENESIHNLRQKEPAIVDPRKGIRSSRLKQFFTTDAINMEHLCKDKFDRSDKGVINKIIYDGIDKGVSKSLKFRQNADDYFTKELKGINFDRWSESFNKQRTWKKNVDYHDYKLESGKMLKLTKAERIALYLGSKNENNLRHILEGGVRLSTNPNKLYTITPSDLSKITNSLSKSEIKVANTIHKYFNVIQKTKINKESVKLNGWEIATEKDYFPIRVYGADIQRGYLFKGEMLPPDMKSFTRITLEGMGILKPRVKSGSPLILEDVFTATFKNITKISSYYGLASPLRQAKALTYSKNFRTNIEARYGKHYWKTIENYLRDIEGEFPRTDNVDKIVMGWINKLDVAILGMNPFVMLKQPISLMAANTEIGSKYLLKSLKGKPEKIEVMSKYSTQLRDRFEGNVTRELGEIAGVGKARQFWTHKHTIGQNLLKGLRRFDYEAIGRIWKAAEAETGSLYPNLKGEAKMNHIALRTEEIVRSTQPTFHLKDRSAIGRSRNTFVRLATKYTSQRNKNYMMIFRAVDRYNNSNKSAEAKARFMKDIAIITLLMPLMLRGVDALRDLAYRRKKTEREKGIKHEIFKLLEYNLGNVYFVGPAFTSVVSKAERGEFAGYDVNNILMSTGEAGINAVANTIRAVDQVISKEKYDFGDRKGELKWKFSAIRATDQALTFGLHFRGIPYRTIRNLALIPFKGEKEVMKVKY